MTPDICTSLHCSGSPKGYCVRCSHAFWFGEGRDAHGVSWRWEFSPRFGPLFVTKRGEPLKHQPLRENHPAWVPFERWLQAHSKRLASLVKDA